VVTVTPFLWFEGTMQPAVNFYLSVFKQSRLISMNPMSATFELQGQQLMALNAGPHHKFNEAISLFVACDDQDEVDYYWSKLGAGGAERQCGWLKDQFGLSWQVIPRALGRMLGDPDRAKANRVMQAMLAMHKMVIAELETAHQGGQ
jgi:predicted 3-demethylubiquinone-9 3-methyltransferase (glyoxalase superfamily)